MLVIDRDGLNGSGLHLRAPIKTGNKEGLKVSYDEGRAIHISPESCSGNGDIIGEALTRESAPMNRDLRHAEY